ncbi:MAG: hypothetical protein ACYTHN_10245, partial [Planctomycetota bacterium]
MRKLLAGIAGLTVVCAGAFGAYESSFGLKVVPTHLHLGKPINFKFAYNFSHGLQSFGGLWRGYAGGGQGDSAALETCPGAGEDEKGLNFRFHLRPGGDTWTLLNFKPGRFSVIDLTPTDGFFLRAQTHGFEMDGYPARWHIQIRVKGPDGKLKLYRTPNFEILDIWQTFYVSTLQFGDETTAGLFAGGIDKVRLFDLSFIPHTEKYRKGNLMLDTLIVYGSGRKIPGIDTDGDGVPDYVDGDDDNDGMLDFAQGGRDKPLVFRRVGYMQGDGRWEGRFTLGKVDVSKDGTLSVDVEMRVESPEVARAIDQIPEIVGILVGERRYDKNGDYHAFSNHLISTLLTPAGFPIENYQNLLPTRKVRQPGGIHYASPLDAVSRVPRAKIRRGPDELFLQFEFRVPVEEVPEGHYWVYFEFGVQDQDGYFLRLDSLPFEARRSGIGMPKTVIPRAENLVFEKKNILPMVRIGNPAPPRMPWALMMDQEVHGVRGIVPEEEKGKWALNPRNRLGSRPIYPPGSYNLEPGFPSLANIALNIKYPLNPVSGEVTVEVSQPDGEIDDLGTAQFQALTQWGATTRTGRFMYDFREYGEYKVRMMGWILDAYGNRFQGGGTYRLWIAERITFGTFPSLPYQVGQGFHSAVEVVPPVPADITLTIDFYPHSDPARKETFVTKGKGNRLGLFVAPEKYVFKEPGEYFSRFDAKYKAYDGTLWLGSLWGSMVVAPKESPLIAHGRTGYMRDGFPLPTRPRFRLDEEGSVETGVNHFLFIPHYSGDIMFIASTMDHHNFIYPLMTMEFTDTFIPYGGMKGKQVIYQIFPTTETGYTPFCFPETVDRMVYFYADAWRPGVSGRHLIAAADMMNAYWSTSPSTLGRQMHASENGDLPGDYYRFTGGVVYREKKTGKTAYGIYSAMGVVTPKGSKMNGIGEGGTTPLFTLNGREHYLFLGGGVLPVPGMILLEG